MKMLWTVEEYDSGHWDYSGTYLTRSAAREAARKSRVLFGGKTRIRKFVAAE